jgi:hypothetical protein
VLAIEIITPTFVLPRQGEGINALPLVGLFVSLATTPLQIFEGGTKDTKVVNNYDSELVLLVTFVVRLRLILNFEIVSDCDIRISDLSVSL